MNERNPQKRARLIKEYAAAKRLAEQDFQRAHEPSAPGRRSAVGPREPANPPRLDGRRSAGPRPSSSPVAPAPPRETALPGTARPRSSPPPARPGRVGLPPTARTPSQILRESESLDRADPSPTPPPGRASSRRPTRAEPPDDPESDDLMGRPVDVPGSRIIILHRGSSGFGRPRLVFGPASRGRAIAGRPPDEVESPRGPGLLTEHLRSPLAIAEIRRIIVGSTRWAVTRLSSWDFFRPTL